MTTALVTGANSGIGRATSIYLAQQGMDVYATMRTVGKAEKLLKLAGEAGVSVTVVELDVSDDDSVKNGVAEVMEKSGGAVDVLVNNAGIGGNGVTEFTSIETYKTVLDVDLLGNIRCIQAVLPGMREQGSGCIVNVTSIAGIIAALAQSPYAIAKRGAEAMSEGLAQEVAQFGIRVAIVEPGITKSAIFAKNIDMPGNEVYPDQLRRMFQFYAAGIPTATPAEEAGRVIHHAITTDDPKLRYTVGVDGAAVAAGYAAMTDEEWVAMGAKMTDAEYYDMWEAHFGYDIRPQE